MTKTWIEVGKELGLEGDDLIAWAVREFELPEEIAREMLEMEENGGTGDVVEEDEEDGGE